MKIINTFAISTTLLFTSTLVAQNGTAVFEVTFTSTWSKSTHPINFPSNPHYSPLIGATHNSRTRLWTPGGIATNGIEVMAETGSTSPLRNEINSLISAGGAKSTVSGSGLSSPGSARVRFTVYPSHPQLTIVSMLAPSPDWFVGLSGFDLMKGGRWIDRASVGATLWDAGTDNGVTYTSSNSNTNPKQKIAVVSTSQGPFKGYSTRVGTWTIRRVASTQVYGCGINPKGSMKVMRGVPLLGQSVTFTVTDPTKTMSKNAIAYLLFSFTADTKFPCGTRIPGFGMASPTAVGEFLIGSILATVAGGMWNGSPVEFSLAIPNDSNLIGGFANLQGGLASSTNLGLTDAVEVHIGK